MCSEFVDTALALYNRLDEKAKAIYSKVLKVPTGTTISGLEFALKRYETRGIDLNTLIEDMKADIH